MLPNLRLYPEELFKSDYLKKNIQKKSLKGGSTSLASKFAQVLLQLCSTVVLARLLTPEDYGVIAMVVVITGFAEIFSNFGLSTATIRKEQISANHFNALFWINITFGCLFALLIVLIAKPTANFYKVPDISAVMTVLAFNFILKGIAPQHQAMLTRHMRFKSLAMLKILSEACTVSVGILLAYFGFNYWALVYGRLAGSLFSVIFILWLVPWKPGSFTWDDDLKKSLIFGKDYAIFNIFSYFSRNLDNVLIGKFLGQEPLGLYSRAFHLLNLINKNITAPLSIVAMPALSRLQDKPDQYRNYCKKFTHILAFITMPLAMYMMIYAEYIIDIVLGSQWYGAIDLFRIFAALAFIQSVAEFRNTIMVSLGMGEKLRKWGFLYSFLAVSSFTIGLYWGVKGVACSYVAMSYLVFFPSLHYCFRGSAFSVSDLLKSIYIPVIASVIMGICCFWFTLMSQLSNNILICLSGALLGLIVYVSIYLSFKGGRSFVFELLSYFKIIFNK